MHELQQAEVVPERLALIHTPAAEQAETAIAPSRPQAVNTIERQPDRAFLQTSFDSRVHKTLSRLAICGSILALATPTYDRLNLFGGWVVSDAEALVENIFETAPYMDTHTATSAQAFNYLESFSAGNGLFKDSQEGWYASTWAHATLLNTFATMALLPGKIGHESKAAFQETLTALNSYWEPAEPQIPGAYNPDLVVFHNPSFGRNDDDTAWIALLLNNGLDKNPALRHRAKQLFALSSSQWDKQTGGTYWKEQLPGETDHVRAVVSNAPFVRLGIELYKATGNQYYLGQSEKIFDWIHTNLFDTRTGLYNDHINNDGSVDTHKRLYVEGLMVRATALLSQYNPAKYSLENAVGLAERSLEYYKTHHSYGISDSEYFRDVMWTAHQYNTPAFTQAVKQALKNALASTPRHSRYLRQAAGDVQLIALNSLPFDAWGHVP